MSEEIIIGKRYSIVVPKKVRKRLNLKEGQSVIVREEGGRIIVEPLPEDPYRVLAETIGDFSYNEEEHEKKAEEWIKKVAYPRH